MQNGWCGMYNLCVVIMVTVSTKLNIITIAMLTHRPSSLSLPRWRQECKANVISVIASASFFWINWFWAKGLPNCFRSIVYCRAISTQAYDGEGIYQIFKRTNLNGNRFKNWPNPKYLCIISLSYLCGTYSTPWNSISSFVKASKWSC